MFYRFKFDSHLSEIFKDAGLSHSIFKIWPAGQTPIAVRTGKAMGWEPPEAAAVELTSFVFEGLEDGRLDVRTASALIHSCLLKAQNIGLSGRSLEHIENAAKAVGSRE